jgi:hypothetical protein
VALGAVVALAALGAVGVFFFEAIGNAPHQQFAATRIGNRVALARAMALGLGVVETANATPAAAEITALAEEVRGSLPH